MRYLALLAIFLALPAHATRQIIIARPQTTIGSSPAYWPVMGTVQGSASNFASWACPVPIPGNFIQLNLSAEAALTAGHTNTGTLEVNGSSSALSATVTGPATETQNRSTVPVIAGDLVRWVTTYGGGATSHRPWLRSVFDSTQSGWSWLCSTAGDSATANDPDFLSLSGQTVPTLSPVCTAEGDCTTFLTGSGTVRHLECKIQDPPGAGSTVTCTVRHGTGTGAMADTAISCPIAGASATTCSNHADSFTWADGDRVTLAVGLVDGGGLTLPKVAYGLGFRTDIPDGFLIPGSSANATSKTANRYMRPHGRADLGGAIDNGALVRQGTGHALTLRSFHCTTLTAPTFGTFLDVTMRDLTTDLATAFQIIAGETGDTWTGNQPVTEDGLLNIKIVPNLLPPATIMRCCSLAVASPRRPRVMEAEEIGVEHGP